MQYIYSINATDRNHAESINQWILEKIKDMNPYEIMIFLQHINMIASVYIHGNQVYEFVYTYSPDQERQRKRRKYNT